MKNIQRILKRSIIKNGAVEVKFFNDKTSKEEIAFFDLKQLTKV